MQSGTGYSEGDKIKIVDSFKNNSRCTSSIDLGNIGENYVKKLIEELNLNIINTSKVAHQSDLRVIDEKYKIIYLLEVKNKNNIDKEDIDKFKRDIENITKSHKDYIIVPLFLSLNTETINDKLRSFSYKDNIIYLTKNYISKETLRIIFKLTKNHIKFIQNNSNVKEAKELKDEVNQKLNSVVSSTNKIETLANEIIDENRNLQNLVTQNLPRINLDVLKIQTKNILINYITNDPNWTLFECKRKDPHRFFIKTSTRRTEVEYILGIKKHG